MHENDSSHEENSQTSKIESSDMPKMMLPLPRSTTSTQEVKFFGTEDTNDAKFDPTNFFDIKMTSWLLKNNSPSNPSLQLRKPAKNKNVVPKKIDKGNPFKMSMVKETPIDAENYLNIFSTNRDAFNKKDLFCSDIKSSRVSLKSELKPSSEEDLKHFYELQNTPLPELTVTEADFEPTSATEDQQSIEYYMSYLQISDLQNDGIHRPVELSRKENFTTTSSLDSSILSTKEIDQKAERKRRQAQKRKAQKSSGNRN